MQQVGDNDGSQGPHIHALFTVEAAADPGAATGGPPGSGSPPCVTSAFKMCVNDRALCDFGFFCFVLPSRSFLL